MIKRYEKIIDWLRSMEIENYIIHDDLTVDVEGDVRLSNKGLSEIPIQFGIVTGYFSCNYNNLISLKGSPHEVRGYFSCYNNKLTSLEGSPKTIGDDFFCSSNQLTSLKGSPHKVGGSFNCHDNQLTSIEGGPEEVGGDFLCYNNKLTSLKGMPQEIVDDIIFSPIKNLDYLEEYKGNYDDIKINFNLLKKIMKSHELKERLENELIKNTDFLSKKFKI